MKPLARAAALSIFSMLLSPAALAQEDGQFAEDALDAPGAPADDPVPPQAEWDEQYPGELDRGAPVAQGEAPSPEPQALAEPRAPADGEVPSGQWVRTEQYGWVWMPYDDAYTMVPPDGTGEPYIYMYAPAYGWTWLVAPWVWGIGPWPYFGVYGTVHFGWYHHGWWRTPGRWHWAPARYHHGFRYGGGIGHFAPPRPGRYAPAPSRGGPFHHDGALRDTFRGGPRVGPAERGSGGSWGHSASPSGGSSGGGWSHGRGAGSPGGGWGHSSGGSPSGGGWGHSSGGSPSGGGWGHSSGGVHGSGGGHWGLGGHGGSGGSYHGSSGGGHGGSGGRHFGFGRR